VFWNIRAEKSQPENDRRKIPPKVEP